MRGIPLALSITGRGRCRRNEYAHSRKRYKPSVADSAAAMVQRKGDSFPCFIPEKSSRGEPLRLALEINSYENLLACALSPAEQAIVKYNCLNSNRAKRHRRRVIRNLGKFSERLRPLQRRLSTKLPASSPAR